MLLVERSPDRLSVPMANEDIVGAAHCLSGTRLDQTLVSHPHCSRHWLHRGTPMRLSCKMFALCARMTKSIERGMVVGRRNPATWPPDCLTLELPVQLDPCCHAITTLGNRSISEVCSHSLKFQNTALAHTTTRTSMKHMIHTLVQHHPVPSLPPSLAVQPIHSKPRWPGRSSCSSCSS